MEEELYQLKLENEELKNEIEEWKDKYSELEEELRENYKPISKYEFHGVNERDF